VDISFGADWPDSSSAEKDLGILQDNKVISMSQQCTPVAKANSCLGCQHIKGGDPPLLFSSGEATSGALCSVLHFSV